MAESRPSCRSERLVCPPGIGRFRTCPITETGFFSISSNPAFTPAAVATGEVLELLHRMTILPGYAFWPDDLPTETAFAQRHAASHRMVTDGYLLAVAISHGGILATLDRWEGDCRE